MGELIPYPTVKFIVQAPLYLTLLYIGRVNLPPPKLFYLRSSKPLTTVWKNPQKYVNQLRLRRFYEFFSLFEAFS